MSRQPTAPMMYRWAVKRSGAALTVFGCDRANRQFKITNVHSITFDDAGVSARAFGGFIMATLSTEPVQ